MPPWGAAGSSSGGQPRLLKPSEPPSSARGPSGLACAGELARHGVKVTIFEALHVAGGVLKYGIPEFRLPDIIIDAEIENLKKMGVEIRLDTIIGKLFTIPQLLTRNGFRQRPSWARARGRRSSPSIPGEAFNGVFSANEFLTRVNLMRGYRQPIYDTPVGMGKARCRGRRGQYRHGCLRAWPCAWAPNR